MNSFETTSINMQKNKDFMKMIVMRHRYRDRLSLAKIYNCQCTDCGGNDAMTTCLVEKAYENMLLGKKFMKITRL